MAASQVSGQQRRGSTKKETPTGEGEGCPVKTPMEISTGRLPTGHCAARVADALGGLKTTVGGSDKSGGADIFDGADGLVLLGVLMLLIWLVLRTTDTFGDLTS